jgi:acetyl esterase/lipase
MLKCFQIATLVFFTLVLITCKKKTDDPIKEEPAVAKNELDVSYGSDFKQKFNIYLPANRSSETTPVLFLIHGGAWRAGDRSDFNSVIDGLKIMFPNYAFVSMSYRLYNAGINKFPTQEMDVKNCVEYVLSRHQDFKISTSFGLLGTSAGAHLAMLYGYKYENTAYKAKAIVSLSGPTDFISIYNTVSSPVVKGWLSDVAGNLQTSDSLVYIAGSPMRFATNLSAPTLLIQGQSDTIVPYQQADLMNSKLNQLGVPHVYKLYPNEGHAYSTNASNDALIYIQSFLNTHLK